VDTILLERMPLTTLWIAFSMNQLKTQTVDDSAWWEQLYQAGRTPWDIGRAAPPLEAYLNSPYAVPPGKIAVLGCGSGHDCMLFASKKFEVTGVDFAPSAIQKTFEKFNKAGINGTNGFLLERDFFNIHEYDNYYDYVLEHCCFSAIDPSRRRTYFYTVRDLLVPGGKLIALWWILDKPGGPPFSVFKDELYALFDGMFTIDMAIVPTNSIPERKGQELLTVLTVNK